MRFILIPFVVLLSVSSACQENSMKQIKMILADSANHFYNFREILKNATGSDSVYYSNTIIGGTEKNEISLVKGMSMYSAIIADSLNEEQARKITDDWRRKLAGILGRTFAVKQIEIVAWNPAKYGWKFANGNVWVDITLYPAGTNSSLYWVGFSITYLYGDFRMQ